MTYQKLLDAPSDHLSPEFIEYIRKENVVVAENDEWILIENCKYHNKKSHNGWYTAFVKSDTMSGDVWMSLMDLYNKHAWGWEMLVKREGSRSVRRYHVHFIE